LFKYQFPDIFRRNRLCKNIKDRELWAGTR
jgi:hypothetical protein